MSANPTPQDIEWLYRLIAGGNLTASDIAQVNRLVVKHEGRLPKAGDLPSEVREKLFPRRTLPVPPIQFPNKLPKRRA
jgi:hypothetical protein